MRISDWSSDVCSSDLCRRRPPALPCLSVPPPAAPLKPPLEAEAARVAPGAGLVQPSQARRAYCTTFDLPVCRSEEHTSELQSLMRTSYAVCCSKKKKNLSH